MSRPTYDPRAQAAIEARLAAKAERDARNEVLRKAHASMVKRSSWTYKIASIFN